MPSIESSRAWHFVKVRSMSSRSYSLGVILQENVQVAEALVKDLDSRVDLILEFTVYDNFS
eukprot:359049-Amorphochlora_amoeboformis.AAC.1